jgi:hypothetical protein
MSKILLVEPYKMLQHAFVAALFPEHEVKILENPPAAESFAAGADLVIVDAAALRTRKTLPADEVRRPWQLPTIWIDNEPPTRAGSSTIARLTLPLTREDLRAAVAGLLRAVVEPAANPAAGQAHSPEPRKQGAAKAKHAEPTDGKNIIELVEVFEENEEGNEGAEASPRD